MLSRNRWGYIHRNYSLYDAMGQNPVMYAEPFSWEALKQAARLANPFDQSAETHQRRREFSSKTWEDVKSGVTRDRIIAVGEGAAEGVGNIAKAIGEIPENVSTAARVYSEKGIVETLCQSGEAASELGGRLAQTGEAISKGDPRAIGNTLAAVEVGLASTALPPPPLPKSISVSGGGTAVAVTAGGGGGAVTLPVAVAVRCVLVNGRLVAVPVTVGVSTTVATTGVPPEDPTSGSTPDPNLKNGGGDK